MGEHPQESILKTTIIKKKNISFISNVI